MATRRQTTFTVARNTLEMSSPCSDGNIRHRRMTKAIALDMMHALDDELHPWGEPGVVPTVSDEENSQDFWMSDGGAPLECVVDAGGVVWTDVDERELTKWPEETTGTSFRRRWTPAGPVTP